MLSPLHGCGFNPPENYVFGQTDVAPHMGGLKFPPPLNLNADSVHPSWGVIETGSRRRKEESRTLQGVVNEMGQEEANRLKNLMVHPYTKWIEIFSLSL